MHVLLILKKPNAKFSLLDFGEKQMLAWTELAASEHPEQEVTSHAFGTVAPLLLTTLGQQATNGSDRTGC